MKKKLVLMKNMAYNYETVVIIDDAGDVSYYENDHAALSKVVEVDFPALDSETIIKKQVAIIDRQITKVRADAEASVTSLDGRKQELLALGHGENNGR